MQTRKSLSLGHDLPIRRWRTCSLLLQAGWSRDGSISHGAGLRASTHCVMHFVLGAASNNMGCAEAGREARLSSRSAWEEDRPSPDFRMERFKPSEPNV